MKAKWEKGGDVANEQGFSYFPGNTNTLLFKLPEYVANLELTKGVIPEFVNPKYADEERNKFKAPTRLECMMQDYPKLLSSKGAVGFTSYDTWYCFSPAKNNLVDAAACVKKGLPSYGASQAEYEFYNWTNNVLEKAGVKIIRNDKAEDYSGIQLAFGPRILLDPTFAISFSELKQKFIGDVTFTADSSCVLTGLTSKFENCLVDGHIVVKDGDHLTGP